MATSRRKIVLQKLSTPDLAPEQEHIKTSKLRTTLNDITHVLWASPSSLRYTYNVLERQRIRASQMEELVKQLCQSREFRDAVARNLAMQVPECSNAVTNPQDPSTGIPSLNSTNSNSERRSVNMLNANPPVHGIDLNSLPSLKALNEQCKAKKISGITSSKNTKNTKGQTYRRQIIYFDGQRNTALNTTEKEDFMKKKKIMTLKFCTNSSAKDIQEKIISNAPYKSVTSIKIFKQMGKIICEPPLEKGETFDGETLFSEFVRQPIYVQCMLASKRKSSNIKSTISICSQDVSSNTDSEEDVFKPAAARKNTQKLQEVPNSDIDETSEDSDIDDPPVKEETASKASLQKRVHRRTKRACKWDLEFSDTDSDDLQEQQKLKKRRSPLGLSIQPITPHKFEVTDELGIVHILEDVIPGNIEEKVCDDRSKTFDPLCVIKKKKKGVLNITVKRSEIVQDLMKRNFSCLNALRVKFYGEDGHDNGGLSLEYQRNLLDFLRIDVKILEGDNYDKHLVYNARSLKENKYKFLGKAIQLSLLNEGPYPQFFSPELYHLLIHPDLSGFNLDVSSLKNPIRREDLQLFKETEDVDTLNALLSTCETFLQAETCNYINGSTMKTAKEEVIRDVVHWFSVDKLRAPLAQLRDGLTEETDLLSLIKDNEVYFRSVFCYIPNNISAADISRLFNPLALSQKEKQTATFWHKFLEDTEAGNTSTTLEKILIFTTSLSRIPPLGYRDKPYASFVESAFPTASTCVNWLALPTENDTYLEFKQNMGTSIENNHNEFTRS